MVGYFPNHSKRVFVDRVNYITCTRLNLSDEGPKAENLRPGSMIIGANMCVMESMEKGNMEDALPS